MSRGLLTAVLAVAALLGGAGPAGATSLDRRSTARFIAASVATLKAAVAGTGRSRSVVDALATRVVAQCPGSLPAPGGPESTAVARVRAALNKEVGVELGLAELTPIRPAFVSFARRVGRLRWTVPAINRAVTASLRSGRLALSLVPPDLCGDIAAAAASGFTTLPAETYAFLRGADASLLRPGPAFTGLLALMKPFTGPAQAQAVRHLDRLQRRLDALLGGPSRAAYDRLERALTGS
jgi:hypothetical protein